MRIGVDQYSLRHLSGLNSIELLDYSLSLGFQGVQFTSIGSIDPKHDVSRLCELRCAAESRGMYIDVGIPCINPHSPVDTLTRDGDGDIQRGILKHLEKIAKVAVAGNAVRCCIGGPGDRLKFAGSWKNQISDAIYVAKSARKMLKQVGLKLAVENHGDISTHEVIEIVEEIGTDIAGICFDTGNPMITLEEPLEAAKRVAPYVIATHIKDAILVFGDQGLILSPRPLGQGVLKVAEIFRVLYEANKNISFSIEDYAMLISVPAFEPEYLNSFELVSLEEVMALMKLARRCEESISCGNLESANDVERVPWSNRATSRLKRSSEFARAVVDEQKLLSG